MVKEKSIISEPVNPIDFGIDPEKGVPVGLKLGEKAPGFAGRDIYGEPFDLYGVLKDQPVVLLFYRGNWCPYCSKQMTDLKDSLQLILNKGARVVAVTPEMKAEALALTEKSGLHLSIIPDAGANIMDAFNVTFSVTEDYQMKVAEGHGKTIAANNGQSEAKLPVPATYIIDKEGTVRYVHFDLNYRNRATSKEILHALDQL